MAHNDARIFNFIPIDESSGYILIFLMILVALSCFLRGKKKKVPLSERIKSVNIKKTKI